MKELIKIKWGIRLIYIMIHDWVMERVDELKNLIKLVREWVNSLK